MSARTWASLLSLAVLWGGSFFFAKVALHELSPLGLVFGRVALAALALNVVLAMQGRSLFRRDAPWPSYMIMGFLNNIIPFALIFWAQTEITSGLASILNATTPLFTLVIAHVATADERMGIAKIGALLLGLGGVAVLIGPSTVAQGGSVWAQIACLGAASAYAMAGVFGRRFKALGVTPNDAATGQVTASAVLILPAMLAIDRPWLSPGLPSVTTWVALAGLALVSTALAYVLYFRILAEAGPTNLLLVTLLIPAVAVVLGAAALGEQLQAYQCAGMFLIGCALAVIDGRILRAWHPAK